jgi:hypothetical protein
MHRPASKYIKLQDAIDFSHETSLFRFFVEDREIDFYDDYGDGGDWFLFGYEYGSTRLIRSRDECDAYSVFIDLEPVVPFDEIHEAFGSFDKLLEHMLSKGYENDYQLRCFCNRWCKFYFQACTKNINETGSWDDWPLIEGYEYQSNSTGSGIVNVGYYLWMREVPPSQIVVYRKDPQ